MKSYLTSLMCAALAGAAWAADAPPPECAPPCAPKACVPEPTVKKIDKAIFDEKCVDYCLPKCSLFSLLSGHGCGCGDGGCTNCGCPRTRHVLIKRWVHEECPDTKCEVQEQPICPPAPAPHP